MGITGVIPYIIKMPSSPSTIFISFKDEQSEEYQNYLIARDYQPGTAKREFEQVKKLSRSEARRPKVKPNQVRKLNFFTTYNPSLPNMDTLVKKYLPLLHSDENLKELFPVSLFNTI